MPSLPTPLTWKRRRNFAVLLSAESARLITERDGWTIRTHNRCLAAHYEHTIVITRGEPKILTAVS